MPRYKTSFFLIITGLLLVFGSALWLSTATPVTAQCGSQASSCKNCHEVQGQLSVNMDGTAWHQSHAFGDFCYICHAGNNQATEIEAAHAGMVPPLSDVKAACQQCHPTDLDERAQVYASTLGVEVGMGSNASAGASPNAEEPSTPIEPGASSETSLVVRQPTIDYVQQYNETVLGQAKPINWGNVILIIMAFALLVGGGIFIYFNERKLRGVTKPAEVVEVSQPINPGDFPSEVIALMPQIAALNPMGRRALHHLLTDPETASSLLYSLSKIDPDLIRKFKALDREAQALLLALSAN